MNKLLGFTYILLSTHVFPSEQSALKIVYLEFWMD
jgi:hypothetical protein